MTNRVSRRSLRPMPQSMMSRLTRLSLLEPTQREVGSRRIRWSAIVLPLVAVALVLGVREVGRVEKVLAAEGNRASRVIVYELLPGQDLRVPIEPGTDVFRIVAHAMRHGPLTPQPHSARLVVTANGEKGHSTDDLVLDTPGTTARVNPEEHDLVVGDPIAANVDVHGIGVGELSVALAAVEGADGVLVRIYRRDALERPAILKRSDRLEEAREVHLARRAGEVDWADLDDAERLSLLGARWRRVAALRGGRSPATHAIALAGAPPQKNEPDDADPALSVVDVRADERVAVLVKGTTTVRARADGDPNAMLVATVRDLDGKVSTQQARGEIVVKVGESELDGLEIGRQTPGPISLRASNPANVEPTTHSVAWRVTPRRSMVVAAHASPIVLRVSARRPVPRSSNEPALITLRAAITAPGASPSIALLRAMRVRSPFERYDSREPVEAPTTSAVFHLLVPENGSVTITPLEPAIDLSLSELDPEAIPQPVRSVPAELATAQGPSATAHVERIGTIEWQGFLPRKPSNASEFEPENRRILRIPHRLISVPNPPPKAPTFRVRRPDVSDAIVIHGKKFEPSTVSYEIDVPPGEPLVLPVRVFSREPLDVVVRVDGATPDRRTSGVAERVTVARKISADQEVKSIVVLGDDLGPGTHVLSFTPPPGKQAWVHLPWVPKPRQPGSPPPDPHWIEGDLDE